MARIKDTDYLAISARVRAMETTLMTPERMERLLEAHSEDEVTRLLQDCGYPALDAALRRVRPGTYRIRVIHGHHGGTALRELVRREYGRHPQVLRLEAAGPGVTELVLREF